MKKIILLIIITISYCRAGVPGDLDSTFGVNGIVKIPPQIGVDLIILNNGKLLIPGTIWTGRAQGFLVMRFNPDGSFDSTFGENGKVISDLGQRETYANAIVPLVNGQIIAAGFSTNTGKGWSTALVKYNEDGSIDSLFGKNGIASTYFEHYLEINSAILYENKILISGFTSNTDHDISIIKYNLDGSLDSLFGVNGRAFADFNWHDESLSIAIQKDGKILLCGYTYEKIDNKSAAIVRFNSDGIVDSTFGKDGTVLHNLGYSTNAQGIAVDNEDNIFIKGSYFTSISTSDSYITKFSKNGKVDKSFGIAGTVHINYGLYDATLVNKVFLLSDGSIIFPWQMEGARFAVVRFDKDGKLDPNFGYARTKKYLPIGYLIAGSFTPEGNLLLLGKGTVPGEPFSFFLKVLLTDEVSIDNIYNSNDEISLYPNPVGNEALVQYDVTTDSHVTIEVYNYMGQQVTVLLDSEYHSIGRHIRRLDFSTLHNPGVYFLKQKIGNDIKILKFMK